MLIILLNAASKVSVILFAKPHNRNKLVISAKGRIGVSLFVVASDIIFLLGYNKEGSGF